MPAINSLLNKVKDIDARESLLLLSHVLKKDKAYLLAHDNEQVDEKKADRFVKLVKRRLKNEPIAYLVQNQPFYGFDYKVNHRVLIPRPETETLVEEIHEAMSREEKRKKKLVVVDIGTGSGCIACSIKKLHKEASVIASDDSPATLSVVKYNDNKLSTGLKLIHSNLFDSKLRKTVAEEFSTGKNVALFVVANLPYLPYSDMDTMQKDVINYEPKNALFADDDGMALIKKCIQQLQDFITHYPASSLCWFFYFEIDPRQVKSLRAFAKENFKEAQVKFEEDLCGRVRFMRLTKRG